MRDRCRGADDEMTQLFALDALKKQYGDLMTSGSGDYTRRKNAILAVGSKRDTASTARTVGYNVS